MFVDDVSVLIKAGNGGNGAVSFRHEKYVNGGNNLICRIFDSDLRLASHIANLASTCAGAMRLLKIHFREYYRILNFNSCFYKCKNLISATGFGLIINNDNGYAGGLFEQCFSTYSVTLFCKYSFNPY